ncbi:MAG: aspartate aminotransferase family protein [Verrucomicrobiia bacterium]
MQPSPPPHPVRAWNLERSFALHRRASQIIPGAAQTTSKRAEAFAFGGYPIFLQRGEGCRVWDVDGNEYVDFVSALGPIILGYADEAVDDAARRQMREGVILSLPHPIEIEAAEALRSAIPNAEMVRFFKSGAEATSAAVRLARAITGRSLVAHCGYHGWHDVWSATSHAAGVTEGVKRDVVEFDYDAVDAVEQLFASRGAELACVMINPVAYHLVSDGSFLRRLRTRCDERGALLVFDEIVTGFRLSLGGAQEHFGVQADVACFAKAIANGYPVSAVTGPRRILEQMRPLVISTTYGGETLSLAALKACVAECRRRDVPAHAARIGRLLMDGLNRAARAAGVPARWEGYPAFSACSFQYPEAGTRGHAMTFWLQECARRGVLFRRGGLNFITAAHTEEIVARAIRVGEEVLREMARAVADNRLAEMVSARNAAPGRYEV